MKKTTAAIIFALGAVCVGSTAHRIATRFSQENMFKRQKVMIDSKFKHKGNRKIAYKLLKKKIASMQSATMEEKCRYEEKQVETMKKGSEVEADTEIDQRHYEPYANCKISSQIEDATRVHTLVGAGLVLVGFFGFIASFFKRKETPDEELNEAWENPNKGLDKRYWHPDD